MKLFVQLFLLIFTISTQAQDFKPYKVKSGKIIYEKWKYSTVSGFLSVNGVESAYSKQVPYTAEQVIYYWDEFGDFAFEEVFQVSEFGGKPLPEKVKIFERLWTGDHRYYFDVEENKISDDPYYLRIKCRENFQYYQIIGSWIKTQYMGVEVSGTTEILGKEADYYKIDGSTDLYAWKGLVLKQDDFYTNRKGDERRGENRTKLAVEIDTISEINNSIFNPVWIKRERVYQSFDRNKLDEFLDVRQELMKQADNVEGINIEKNDILFFVTTNHRLGKMQILSCNENAITIKYKWYYNDNSVGSNSDSFLINKNTFIDIDAVTTDVEKTSEVDFRIEDTRPTILFPQNNIGIYRLKASRTNTF
jgi:hypothetical protein